MRLPSGSFQASPSNSCHPVRAGKRRQHAAANPRNNAKQAFFFIESSIAFLKKNFPSKKNVLTRGLLQNKLDFYARVTPTLIYTSYLWLSLYRFIINFIFGRHVFYEICVYVYMTAEIAVASSLPVPMILVHTYTQVHLVIDIKPNL
jgi:hypothetical protein